MRSFTSLTTLLLSFSFVVNVGAVYGKSNVLGQSDERYVCTVWGWNNWTGEEKQILIYFAEDDCQGARYIGREISYNGEPSTISWGEVKITTNPAYRDDYRYYVKTGSIGCYFFNTNAINEEYTEKDTHNTETYVCTVVGTNSFNGENVWLNIYLVETTYCEPYYAGREVDENGNVSFLTGTVYINQNPEHGSSYRYCVKTGFIGAYLFNSDMLYEGYIE